jgi:hypothetical protein
MKEGELGRTYDIYGRNERIAYKSLARKHGRK